MADTTTKLVSELDFEKIKANLSAFIANNSDFTDYNFEGSALSFLTDILAYNTHYNAIYTNLAFNEMFLDSASKRSSVVSISKMLGYTPRSAISARAIVDARIISPTSTPDVATIPALQAFTTVVDNKTYTFYNLEDVTVARSGGPAKYNGFWDNRVDCIGATGALFEFPEQIVCSGALFYAKSTRRFLLLQKAHGKHEGTWGLVGGRKEPTDATPFEALKREIEEEIGRLPDIFKTLPLEKFVSNDSIFNFHTYFYTKLS